MSWDRTKIARAIAMVAIVSLIGYVAYSLGYSHIYIHGNGAVKTIGIEADVSEISWGIVEPGSSTPASFNIRATGNVPVTVVMTTVNWTPTTASNYMALTWSGNGTVFGMDWTPVTLYLDVSTDITGVTNFAFDIIVAGS